jgi:hypothetical protein
MAQISAMVSNGAMAQPTQCSPCLSKTRAARGSLAKSAATVSSAQLMSGARLIRVHPIPWSIVDHRLDYAGVARAVAPWQPYAGFVYFHLLLHGLSLAGAFESAPQQAPMRPEPVVLVQ